MALRLKKLNEQVMVITGSSSGIGLVTARMAAKCGTRLVLSSRSEEELRQAHGRDQGQWRPGDSRPGRTSGDPENVHRVAQAAQEQFGGFDTWVNNAGISIYGKLLEVSIEDMRRVLETNFWGLVYGSLEAARQLKEPGGAIINIGSTLSDRAIPMQGIYSASKHAVKGFTDALRMELESEGAPISVR